MRTTSYGKTILFLSAISVILASCKVTSESGQAANSSAAVINTTKNDSEAKSDARPVSVPQVTPPVIPQVVVPGVVIPPVVIPPLPMPVIPVVNPVVIPPVPMVPPVVIPPVAVAPTSAPQPERPMTPPAPQPPVSAPAPQPIVSNPPAETPAPIPEQPVEAPVTTAPPPEAGPVEEVPAESPSPVASILPDSGDDEVEQCVPRRAAPQVRSIVTGDRPVDLLLHGNRPVTNQGCRIAPDYNPYQICGAYGPGNCPSAYLSSSVKFNPMELNSNYFGYGSTLDLVAKGSSTPLFHGAFTLPDVGTQGNRDVEFTLFHYMMPSSQFLNPPASTLQATRTHEGAKFKTFLGGVAAGDKFVNNYEFLLKLSSMGLNQISYCQTGQEHPLVNKPMNYYSTVNEPFDRNDFERVSVKHNFNLAKKPFSLPGSYEVHSNVSLSPSGIAGLSPLPEYVRDALQFMIFDYHRDCGKGEESFKFAGIYGAGLKLVLGTYLNGQYRIVAERPLPAYNSNDMMINHGDIGLYVHGNRVLVLHEAYSNVESSKPTEPLYLTYTFSGPALDGEIGFGSDKDEELHVAWLYVGKYSQSVADSPLGRLAYENTFNVHFYDSLNRFTLDNEWQILAPATSTRPNGKYGPNDYFTGGRYPTFLSYPWARDNAFYQRRAEPGPYYHYRYAKETFLNSMLVAYVSTDRYFSACGRETANGSSKICFEFEETSFGQQNLTIFKESLVSGKAVRSLIATKKLNSWLSTPDGLKPHDYQSWWWFSLEGSDIKVYKNGAVELTGKDPSPQRGNMSIKTGGITGMDNLAIYQWL